MRRRRLLATLGALTGGCLSPANTETPTRTTRSDRSESPETPTPDTDTPPRTADRATATQREPRSLATGGTWRHRGSDARRDGATDATGVPENGARYWRLRRVRSGPVVAGPDRLYGFGHLNENPDARQTETQTAIGTAQPIDTTTSLIARDPDTGRIAWSQSLPDAFGSPVVADGRVIVGTGGVVAAFEAPTGRPIWRVSIGEFGVSDVVAANGQVIAGIDTDTETAIAAFDAQSGNRRWKRSVEQVDELAVAGDRLVRTGGYDAPTTVAVHRLGDGNTVWTASAGERLNTPAVRGGVVFVSDADGVTARSLADGTVVWDTAVENHGVAVTDDRVYVADETLTALAADSGERVWTFGKNRELSAFAPPAVGRRRVYVVGYGPGAVLHAVGLDGSSRWTAAFQNSVIEGDIVAAGTRERPVVLDGAVYVYAADGFTAFGPA